MIERITKDCALVCSRFGEITTIDCKTLRGKECSKCIIYETLKDDVESSAETSIPFEILEQDLKENAEI